MTEANLENLSAAVDGQLSSDELRFLLRRLDHAPALRDAWSRYQLAGDGLRQQLPPLASAGFADRVMAAIDIEVAAVAAPVAKRRDWVRLSVGGAIAASVAVAALMITQPTGSDGGRQAVAAVHGSSAPANTVAMAPAAAPVSNVLPPSLSAFAASNLSQRASITLGDPSDNPLYQKGFSIQQRNALHGRVISSVHDGSYLMLIDTPQNNAANNGEGVQSAQQR